MTRQRRHPNRQPATAFVIKLRARPGVDGVRPLRWILKRLLRGYQLRCVSVSEERT
jgi:hypothetical protein